MTVSETYRAIPMFDPSRRQSLSRLRHAYFAKACDSASRYGVSFDRVLAHLWSVRRLNRRFTLRRVRCIDDLVHAAACVDGVGLAWADLVERYERMLIRRCRAMYDEATAVLIVRRMLIDLRRCQSRGVVTTASLSAYNGCRPLRIWLCDRLSAILTREAIDRVRLRAAGASMDTNQSVLKIAAGSESQPQVATHASPFTLHMADCSDCSPSPAGDGSAAASA